VRKMILSAVLTGVAGTGLILAGPASAAPKPDPGSIGVTSAPCGTSGPNRENRVEADAPANGTANQRSGSSTGCPAPGALQPTDDALYFCWTSGEGGTWTYLRNVRTGVQGWVRDDLLDLNADGFSRGSIRSC
jgi:hypothetical protein